MLIHMLKPQPQIQTTIQIQSCSRPTLEIDVLRNAEMFECMQ